MSVKNNTPYLELLRAVDNQAIFLDQGEVLG